MLYSMMLAALLDCSCVLETAQPVKADVPAVLQTITEPQQKEKVQRWVDVDSRLLQRAAGLA